MAASAEALLTTIAATRRVIRSAARAGTRWSPLRPTIFDAEVLPLQVSGLGQASPECVYAIGGIRGHGTVKKSDHCQSRLLRARRERPRRSTTAHERNELAPLDMKHATLLAVSCLRGRGTIA